VLARPVLYVALVVIAGGVLRGEARVPARGAVRGTAWCSLAGADSSSALPRVEKTCSRGYSDGFPAPHRPCRCARSPPDHPKSGNNAFWPTSFGIMSGGTDAARSRLSARHRVTAVVAFHSTWPGPSGGHPTIAGRAGRTSGGADLGHIRVRRGEGRPSSSLHPRGVVVDRG